MLGVGVEDLAFDEPWLVVDVLVSGDAVLPNCTVQYCNPQRPTTYVQGPRQLRRWEFMLHPDEDPAAMASEQSVWRLLTPWLKPDQGHIWRHASYRFHAVVAARWRDGNVFLLGDAAHQMPPFMAQGLNQGLRDAGNLCWKLPAVARGIANPDLLDSYEAERKPVAQAVAEITKQFGRIICERDRRAADERDRRMLQEMADGHGIIVRQHLFPPITAGLLMRTASGVPTKAAGSIFPQPWVSTPSGRMRLDDAIGWRFLLIGRPEWVPSEVERQAAQRAGVTLAVLGNSAAASEVRVIAEEGTLIRAWLGGAGVDAALVRPDGVVFGTAIGADGEHQLLKALAAQLTGRAAQECPASGLPVSAGA